MGDFQDVLYTLQLFLNVDQLFQPLSHMVAQSQYHPWLCAGEQPQSMTLKALHIGWGPAWGPGVKGELQDWLNTL